MADTGTALDDSLWDDNVGNTTKGVDFMAQDYVASITATVAGTTYIDSLEDGSIVKDEAELRIEGLDNTEEDFELRVVQGYSGETMGINEKDMTSPEDSITIPWDDSDDYASKEMTFFTAPKSGSAMYFIFTGDDKNTIVSQCVTLTSATTANKLAMEPADPGEYAVSLITTRYSTANVIIDEQSSSHETVLIECYPMIVASDAFGNKYENLKQSELDAVLNKASDNGTITSTVFSGSSGAVKYDATTG